LRGTEYNERPHAITAGGEWIVANRHRDGAAIPVAYSVGKETGRELDLAEGVNNSVVKYQDDAVILAHETSTTPTRLLIYDLTTDEIEVLVDTQTEAIDDLELVKAEQITYESVDDFEVNAILYRADQTPSPAVVYIHGGPTTAEYRDFDPFAQFLVNEGYTVLEPNYRGSTDQDRTFEEAIRGDVGGGEVEDIAEGGRWLANQTWIDANRIAALGHSHGAYNASMLAVRFSELWQLVCVENGIFEYNTKEANPYARRRIFTDLELESSGEFVRERSAMERVDEIECPICLIYGEDDNVEGAQNFAEALKEKGWTKGEEFRFEIIKDEGHVIDDKEFLWNYITMIFSEYV
jgi:dipeptidyl aminopeptidase/acylaminoacyl peptidase